jgi:hypothetical protein
MWLDNLAQALVTFAGKGFDPQGCQLPAFKPKQEHRAALPKQPKKPVEVRDDGLLSDDELAEPNWRYSIHGMDEARLSDFKKDIKQSKAIEVDFDEPPSDMHGITEREYGEMLAYSPQLKDTALAAKVKSMKPTKTLSEIAAILGEKEQLIRHYSSALGKANPSPRRK